MSSLVQVRNPDLFDDDVVSFSVSFRGSTPGESGGPLPDELAAIALPESLRNAAEVRRRSFLAGRLCALRAVDRLARRRTTDPIAIGDGGAPVWPEGIVGSITHTRGFASSAVAWRTRVRRLGVDAEVVMTDATARGVGPLVVRPEELTEVLDATRWDLSTATTLAFSAKESVFKCLYPAVGRRFDYLDAAIEHVTLAAGRFSARLLVDLAPTVRAGDVLAGQFVVDGDRVYTGVAIRAEDPRALAR